MTNKITHLEELTVPQMSAIDIMRDPAYTADGTKIKDSVGKALMRRKLACWDGGAYRLTCEGSALLE